MFGFQAEIFTLHYVVDLFVGGGVVIHDVDMLYEEKWVDYLH
jgi:hypothetical protein